MKPRGMAAAVLLLALAGCSTVEADIPKIEDDIAAQLEEQADMTGIVIDCPDSIDWEVGSEFRCIAETPDGDRVKVTVHMENDEGEYTWET